MQTRIENTTYGVMEYSMYGTGEPILFLHGGHSNAKEILTHKHIDTKKFILITPSRAGYGRTTLGNNESPINASKQIIELMDKLGFDQFNVIGISAGGLTAIALVSLNQHRILKFVLASSISKKWLKHTDGLYKKAKIMFNPKIEGFTWRVLRLGIIFFPKTIIKTMATELTNKRIKKLDEAEISDMKMMLLNQRSKKGFVTDLDQELNNEIIAKIKTPTLIIHSKNDKSVSIEHPKYAKQKIENSQIVWLDNKWGHLIWVGAESKKNIGYIKAFLNNRTGKPVSNNV
ncbi:alpha/beta fold hydrolase [Flagellimonas sp. CMM7]|uniref:alpha/beta fold hydrolase n=1 Tax=Flagellimonas sp. CMM7 TaxID=2654676 RepID=UPI0013D72952|nr:alpha/beta fold hydrolase [Flagellimonas sp. CMM7]UII78210.1 alpha/beta hydrolase [Flagellimonas sp. CMM7]